MPLHATLSHRDSPKPLGFTGIHRESGRMSEISVVLDRGRTRQRDFPSKSAYLRAYAHMGTPSVAENELRALRKNSLFPQ